MSASTCLRWRLTWLAAALVALGAGALAIRARLAPAPATLGLQDGRLAPCPATPNCVTSEASDAAGRPEPLPYAGTRDQTHARLVALLDAWPRVTLVTIEPYYIHAEFRSRLFRFVDDVEFRFDDERRVVHSRSASRVGRGDMGVNAARMREVAAAFNASAGPAR
jgi:uncharacterized protein (DUF1499 family)